MKLLKRGDEVAVLPDAGAQPRMRLRNSWHRFKLQLVRLRWRLTGRLIPAAFIPSCPKCGSRVTRRVNLRMEGSTVMASPGFRCFKCGWTPKV